MLYKIQWFCDVRDGVRNTGTSLVEANDEDSAQAIVDQYCKTPEIKNVIDSAESHLLLCNRAAPITAKRTETPERQDLEPEKSAPARKTSDGTLLNDMPVAKDVSRINEPRPEYRGRIFVDHIYGTTERELWSRLAQLAAAKKNGVEPRKGHIEADWEQIQNTPKELIDATVGWRSRLAGRRLKGSLK